MSAVQRPFCFAVSDDEYSGGGHCGGGIEAPPARLGMFPIACGGEQAGKGDRVTQIIRTTAFLEVKTTKGCCGGFGEGGD